MSTDLSILPHRILSHYDSIRAIERGEIPWPRMAIVYPVRGCNLRCVYCEYEKHNDGPIQNMDFARLNETLTSLQAHGLEGVEFCGGGEPSMHPGLLAEIEHVRHALGLRVGLLTNAFGIEEKDVPALMENLSYIRVSLDAATAETFAKVKGCKASKFEYITRLVTSMVEYRNKHGCACDVSLKMCVNKVNVRDVYSMSLIAEDLGVDSVQYKAARDTPVEVRGASEAAADYHIAIASEGLACRVMGTMQRSSIEGKCILTPLNVVIDTTGETYLCCYFSRREAKHTIGNCFTTPIEDMWGSKRHREAIAGIEPAECNRFDCRFHGYNRVARKMLTEGSVAFL